MSTIQKDFDRIALVSAVSPDGAAHNDHYHNFLLRHLPSNCHDALEIGCGTGGFARRLAERSRAGSAGIAGSPAGQPRWGAMLPAMTVLAIDLSPEMIRLARESSAQFPNIEFQLADVLERPLPVASFDCIASIATLHHLPLPEILLKMKTALKPGGVLLVLDLFEPAGLLDSLSNLLAIPVSVTLRLIHQGRLLPSRAVRDAWAAHERHDSYPTMREVKASRFTAGRAWRWIPQAVSTALRSGQGKRPACGSLRASLTSRNDRAHRWCPNSRFLRATSVKTNHQLLVFLARLFFQISLVPEGRNVYRTRGLQKIPPRSSGAKREAGLAYHCRKHRAPLERRSWVHSRIYKHLAPPEPSVCCGLDRAASLW